MVDEHIMLFHEEGFLNVDDYERRVSRHIIMDPRTSPRI